MLVDEWCVLIELFVVLEMWFFCDCEVFVMFVWLVVEWFVVMFGCVICVLSVLCLMGEELYLVVMVLLDVGFELVSFVIDVIDFSLCVIE